MSLWITLEYSEFHTVTPLPRSFTRSCLSPIIVLPSTKASGAPHKYTPTEFSNKWLLRILARAAALSRKMPASISGRLKPERVTVRFFKVTSGADTETVRPVRSPSIMALCCSVPSMVRGLLIMILPLYFPAAKRSVSPGCAWSMAACKGCEGCTSITAACADNVPANRKARGRDGIRIMCEGRCRLLLSSGILF